MDSFLQYTFSFYDPDDIMCKPNIGNAFEIMFTIKTKHEKPSHFP